MMTKKQSKKMNQLKYLVLIPVLASMLFYTSCSETVSEEAVAKKELQTMYMQIGKQKLTESKGAKEAYLDFYMGTEIPKWKEITYKDLSAEEKLEYDNLMSKVKEKDNSIINKIQFKLFKGDNGRNIIGNIIDFSKIGKILNEERIETEEVSFMEIDKVPTFPGCEEGDKKCFSKMVQKHFVREFDSKMPNSLGLESGKKRIFIGFKIDKEGNVVEVQVRAPHPKIKEEVLKVMSSLPRMIPGEHEGEKVGVKYSIPFTIFIK